MKLLKSRYLSGTKLVGSSPDRGRADNDYYATPFNATRAILKEIIFSSSDVILEPAAGQGHIVKVLREMYPKNEIIASDLVKYKERFEDIYIKTGIDFINTNYPNKVDVVITNPPFKYSKEFVEKALSISKRYVIMFFKIQFLETVERRKLLENSPLKYVYVFSRRVNPMRNGEELNEKGKPWSNTMCFAWFVWDKTYKGEPIVRWL